MSTAPIDPREVETVYLGSPLHDAAADGDHCPGVQIGAPLRDAAVDPQPGDYLPPVNAGLPGPDGDPHGPNVVAPGIR